MDILIAELLIPKSSETGQLLVSLWNDYQDFPHRQVEEQVHKEETQVVAEAMPSPFEPNWGDEEF